MPDFNLKKKVALVTGGNGGIGKAIAMGLGKAGAHVVIAARNQEKTQAALDQFASEGVSAEGFFCDVESKSSIEELIVAIEQKYETLNILVNNAGVSIISLPENITDEDWESVLNTNLRSVLWCSQQAFPLLKKAGGGKIINIASEFSIFGSAYTLSYSASKGGVIQMTKSLAIAWAAHNIQVNAIIPGCIKTDMTAIAQQGEIYDQLISRTPAARFGEPEELAGAAVFLSSAASNFVTGASLAVDGGFSIM
jgi:2-deoxy-D-gluconate 3-dehydrogenase